jgi:hypothetical protein
MAELKMAEDNLPNQIGFYPLEHETVIWDYFLPSFQCPFTVERVGRVGDGGKWVCGLRELAEKPACVVYSFGVNGKTSFEEEILRRTPCTVHMFDPTMDGSHLPILAQFPGRVTFSQLGIGKEDHADLRTLRTLMDRNGDTFMDILKMDVEGAEWEALMQVAGTFLTQLPFAQLQVEVHLSRIFRDSQYVAFRNWWAVLEDAGLRPFFSEPNLLSESGIYLFSEFSFLNVKARESLFRMRGIRDPAAEASDLRK